MKAKKTIILVFALILTLLCTNMALAEPITKNQFSDQEVGKITPEMEKKAEEKESAALEALSQNSSRAILAAPSWYSLSTGNMIKQPDYNTCGPATGYNVLTTWGLDDLDVWEIADDLGYNGQTSFGNNWVDMFDAWIGDFYVVKSKPTKTNLWNAFLSDIGLGQHVGFVMDAYMSPSAGYLVGFANWSGHSTISHYVTAYGYTGEGTSTKNCYYFDSYNYRTGCYGQHYMNLDTIHPIMATYGMIW